MSNFMKICVAGAELTDEQAEGPGDRQTDRTKLTVAFLIQLDYHKLSVGLLVPTPIYPFTFSCTNEMRKSGRIEVTDINVYTEYS